MLKAEAPQETKRSPLMWRLVPDLVAGVAHYRLDGDVTSGSYLSFFALQEGQTAELYRVRFDEFPVRFRSRQALVSGLKERGLRCPLAFNKIPLPK